MTRPNGSTGRGSAFAWVAAFFHSEVTDSLLPGDNYVRRQASSSRQARFSDDEQGRVVRYIEVKGRGPEDADVVTMTGPEWEAARRLGDQHWLYIVLLGDGMLVMIRNPYTKLKPRELKRWLVSVTEAKGHGESIALDGD